MTERAPQRGGARTFLDADNALGPSPAGIPVQQGQQPERVGINYNSLQATEAMKRLKQLESFSTEQLIKRGSSALMA